MKPLDYKKLNVFIASDVIAPFYQIRLERLKSVRLTSIIKRKNPYLFKAKNIETAGDLAKNILDAFLSSQEETIFGDLMEDLAIHVCGSVFSGYKAEKGKFPSVDLIFERDKKLYVVGIKSGPNWGNADQINIMKRNLEKAKQLISKAKDLEIVKVNGCMYGKEKNTFKKDKETPALNYYKICGQLFWELISGDDELYKKIIQPLDKEAKKRDDIFKELYAKKVNEMTKDIFGIFITKNELDWNKIVEYISKNTLTN
jgi:site-specific DNA-methyltransferase (cytosine-N4-specific)